MTDWRIIGAAAAVALLMSFGGLAGWTLLRLRELSRLRDRMSRLADGVALLTDTTESGLATVIREIEQMSRKPGQVRTKSRAAVAKRVAAAARRGADTARIAADELLSESEVRLHLSLAEASRRADVDRPSPRV